MRFFPFFNPAPVVAVIRLHGTIGAATRGAGLSDAALAPLLSRAFRKGRPRAVALSLNSPGGSPVQSSLIAARIRRLAERHELPVHAFVEDVAASGGYWLATAADDIWVDDSSLVGSIGVIAASFGFSELIGRHGIERRVHTAGRSKSMLDPFRPETPEDVARLSRLMEPMHDAFKAQVSTRRGDRLDRNQDLFTGEIWTGRQAVDIGLADGIAHMEPKLRSLYGDKVRLRPYGVRRPFLRRLGLSAADVVDAFADRAIWPPAGAARPW
ncbi:S49 family peptidase [uncultured Paracoccus sp.]|uniref:S49 family peptidase n=1 Tax=uncultured Paracoccus sp. TaxID=189685 RepID=UPI0026275D92|nr:S49 family peptidase [uncultured Paracoccus sp.]